jgi:hypothetical protein
MVPCGQPANDYLKGYERLRPSRVIMSGHRQSRRSHSWSLLSYSPPKQSYTRHIPEALMIQDSQRRLAEENRATAEHKLWERARQDANFAYKIRHDPVYYQGKLREQIYLVEKERRQSVRLPLPQSSLDS